MRSSTKRQREEPPVCGEARSTGSSPGDSSEQRSASSGPGWRVSHSGDGVAALSITPSGCVALGLHAGPIVLLSEGGGGTRRLDGHTGGTLALASGKRGFVSAGADGCVRIWSLDSLTLESARSLEGGTRGVHGALVDTLAVSDDDLWAAASGRCVCVGAIDGLLLDQLRLGRSPHPSPSPSPKPDPDPHPNQVSEQIFVSATSEPAKVAGYISNCVREGPAKARLCITVAGPQPMLRALKAIFLARHHLAEEKLDLSIVPEFGKSDEGVSLVNIFVLSHAVGARI